MILPAVRLFAGGLSAVPLPAGELPEGGLVAVEQPDRLPVGRVNGRIGQPEEHTQVRGRGQGRLDVIPTHRLETRRGDVVWNR